MAPEPLSAQCTMESSLSVKQAVAMQDALIALCSGSEFQERLSAATLLEAGSSPRQVLRRARAQRELCRMREAVGAEFGFEASAGGVAESAEALTPELLADPEVAERKEQLASLVDPMQQARLGEERRQALASWRRWAPGVVRVRARRTAERACQASARAKAEDMKMATDRFFPTRFIGDESPVAQGAAPAQPLES